MRPSAPACLRARLGQVGGRLIPIHGLLAGRETRQAGSIEMSFLY
jgi:hypothetical protein